VPCVAPAVRDVHPAKDEAQGFALGIDDAQVLIRGWTIDGSKVARLMPNRFAGICRKADLKHDIPGAAFVNGPGSQPAFPPGTNPHYSAF